MRIILTLLISLTFYISSDDHDQEDKAVLAAVAKYYAARTAEDFKTQVAMESKNGDYSTNSDGSFHKPLNKQTIAGWEKSGVAVTQYFYPEATAISDDVVHVRFYSEGMVGSDGKMSDYRTRVTMNWIKEDGNWVMRTAHYSPANFGGVYKAQASDFED